MRVLPAPGDVPIALSDRPHHRPPAWRENPTGNLALACPRCNRNKGPNLVGIDKKTHEIAKLYHPRRDRWADHFRWHGPRLRGLTPTGRATIRVLAINDSLAVALCRELILEARSPLERESWASDFAPRSLSLQAPLCLFSFLP